MAARRIRGLRAQFGRFAVVGVLNTLTDYVLFIGLTKIFSIPLDWVWTAKAFSGGVAITNSFILNRQWVFHGQGRVIHEGAAFFAATIIGVYAIQTPLTQLFSSVFQSPGELAFDFAERVGIVAALPTVVTEAFVIKTTAFVLATAASLTWNFFAYRHWVFRERRLRIRGAR
jgi:putative flippase GtrA